MKNLDITIVAPQGAGKTEFVTDLLKVTGVNPERIAHFIVSVGTPHEVADVLRVEAADVVVFDGCLNGPEAHAVAVAGVEIYREITNRKVIAVYCLQNRMINYVISN